MLRDRSVHTENLQSVYNRISGVYFETKTAHHVCFNPPQREAIVERAELAAFVGQDVQRSPACLPQGITITEGSPKQTTETQGANRLCQQR